MFWNRHHGKLDQLDKEEVIRVLSSPDFIEGNIAVGIFYEDKGWITHPDDKTLKVLVDNYKYFLGTKADAMSINFEIYGCVV